MHHSFLIFLLPPFLCITLLHFSILSMCQLVASRRKFDDWKQLLHLLKEKMHPKNRETEAAVLSQPFKAAISTSKSGKSPASDWRKKNWIFLPSFVIAQYPPFWLECVMPLPIKNVLESGHVEQALSRAAASIDVFAVAKPAWASHPKALYDAREESTVIREDNPRWDVYLRAVYFEEKKKKNRNFSLLFFFLSLFFLFLKSTFAVPRPTNTTLHPSALSSGTRCSSNVHLYWHIDQPKWRRNTNSVPECPSSSLRIRSNVKDFSVLASTISWLRTLLKRADSSSEEKWMTLAAL